MNQPKFQIILFGLATAVFGFMFLQWIGTAASQQLDLATATKSACPTATATATSPPPPTPPSVQVKTEARNPCSYLPFIQRNFGTPTPVICPSATPDIIFTLTPEPTPPTLKQDSRVSIPPCVTVTPFPTIEGPPPPTPPLP